MPEGPEIRRAADAVSTALKGRVTLKVRFGLDRLRQYESSLTGIKVNAVETRGKAMLTRFANGLTLYSHNQLYGRWLTGPAEWQPDGNRSLRVEIRNERACALLYSASDIEILDSEALANHPFLAKLGPDVLAETTTVDTILQRMKERRFSGRRLGNLLTDQAFLAGLGNYLRCEILFVCNLHPKAILKQCSGTQKLALAEAALRLPRQSYRTEGITNDLALAAELRHRGESFKTSRFHLFRRDGKPCYRCGGTIEKVAHGGQACYLCPRCQPEP